MTTRKTLALALALGLAIAVSACQKKEGEKPAGQSSAAGSISWMGYTDGMQKAKETGKPVMVDFYTTWCKYCNMLDQTTYKDPQVVEMLNRDFIAIKVNAEGTGSVTDKGKQMTERDLASSYKVSGYPTLFFLDGKGATIGALPGYQSPEELKPVMTFITSGAFAKGIDYAEYLKSVQKK